MSLCMMTRIYILVNHLFLMAVSAVKNMSLADGATGVLYELSIARYV